MKVRFPSLLLLLSLSQDSTSYNFKINTILDSSDVAGAVTVSCNDQKTGSDSISDACTMRQAFYTFVTSGGGATSHSMYLHKGRRYRPKVSSPIAFSGDYSGFHLTLRGDQIFDMVVEEDPVFTFTATYAVIDGSQYPNDPRLIEWSTGYTLSLRNLLIQNFVGGAIEITSGSNHILNFVTFQDNGHIHDVHDGGAVYMTSCTAQWTRVSFHGNKARYGGEYG